MAAANFGICLSLNGGNYWELPIVPDCSLEEREKGERLSWALLSTAPCRQCGKVTEGWSRLGSNRMESGDPRITAGPEGLARKGPQRPRDPTGSCYRWKNGCRREGTCPGAYWVGPARLLGSREQPPCWPCTPLPPVRLGHPRLGAVCIRNPLSSL